MYVLQVNMLGPGGGGLELGPGGREVNKFQQILPLNRHTDASENITFPKIR